MNRTFASMENGKIRAGKAKVERRLDETRNLQSDRCPVRRADAVQRDINAAPATCPAAPAAAEPCSWSSAGRREPCHVQSR